MAQLTYYLLFSKWYHISLMLFIIFISTIRLVLQLQLIGYLN
ncbi:hypothetical protein CBB_A0014 [Clostridium botulinum Bf]|nr:hypothetical protein CBB_A0014 [Clostridium botulinum Bf]